MAQACDLYMVPYPSLSEEAGAEFLRLPWHDILSYTLQIPHQALTTNNNYGLYTCSTMPQLVSQQGLLEVLKETCHYP